MHVLGIESTAHTFGVGICDEERVLTSQKDMYTPEQGGIHPREAAEHHYQHVLDVLNNALQGADLAIDDIDAVAFSRGPGMPPCLEVGAVVARTLALEHGLELYGVNHILGHVEIGRMQCGVDDPVVLFVSGGNSQVIAYAGGRYRVFGETQDIAVGNALDKFARTLGIPHPGGPEIECLAEDGDELVDLSYSVKGMDVSFTGLVTEVQRMVDQSSHSTEDLCFSFQEHAYAMLVEATERAMAHLDKDEVLLTGGVAANNRLRNMVKTMAEDRGATAAVVPHRYAMDNGAMIAWQGVNAARTRAPDDVAESAVRPDWRPDDVPVGWR